MTRPIPSQPSLSLTQPPPRAPAAEPQATGPGGQMSPLGNPGPLTPTCPFDPGLCDAPVETVGWAGAPPLWPPAGRRNTPGGQITETFYMQSSQSRDLNPALPTPKPSPFTPLSLSRQAVQKGQHGVRWRSCRGSACPRILQALESPHPALGETSRRPRLS